MSKRKIKQMFDSTLEETLKVLDNNAELKKENKNLKNEINEKDK